MASLSTSLYMKTINNIVSVDLEPPNIYKVAVRYESSHENRYKSANHAVQPQIRRSIIDVKNEIISKDIISVDVAEEYFGTIVPHNSWPTLESLIDQSNSEIINDVQFILDFAIIAHPKTATSNLQTWLRMHPEIQIHEFENHALAKGRPAELVSDLYHLQPGRRYKRGYKAPRDLIIDESLHALTKYWPKTKLIIGLRHPVLWFESFYNFRIHNGIDMPLPETLIGKLQRGMVGVATDESKFHLHLDNLGKTNHTADELKLLSRGDDKKYILPRMNNPVFLYEVNQLRDTNETRSATFSMDLKSYLELENEFQPLTTTEGPRYSKAITICEPHHIILRNELMKNSREASIWIRTYFLNSPDVTVSSPEYFDQLLLSWMVDPCNDAVDIM